MIPISDDNSKRTTVPFINYLFIAINIFVFIYFQKFGTDQNFIYSYSTVPAEILSGHDIISSPQIVIEPGNGQRIEIPGLGVTALPVWLTIFTSMFMHGGFAHLGGNMLYLFIFGDNLEDKLGHFRYFLFYLLCGVIATFTHVISVYILGENPLLPSLGASGAISGIMGGYLLLFPTNRVTILFIIVLIRVPAFVVLGAWILLQVASGTGFLGGNEVSGIAYAAHIGGFIGGLYLVKKFIPAPKINTKNW